MSQEKTPKPGRLIDSTPAPQSRLILPRRKVLTGLVGGAAGAAMLSKATNASELGVSAEVPVKGQGPFDPSWTRVLGKGVNSSPYGKPSPFESNVVRRISPGLTPTPTILRCFHAATKPVRHHHAERFAL